jgi:TonB family protein
MNYIKLAAYLALPVYLCACFGPLPVKPAPKIDPRNYQCAQKTKLIRKSALERVLVRYPEAARQNSQEGWVVLRFDLVDTKIKNIKVFDASPKGIFEESAIFTLESAVVNPEFKNEVDCLIRIRFALADAVHEY